jgi:hypothetical protein
MGAWSHEPFGNDTASDWAYGLEEAKDLSYIESALDKALECGSEYLEAPEAEEALAAIEVIAKLLGKGTQSDEYTEDVDAWVSSIKLKPQPALLKKAQQVIDRILADESELLELWQESESSEAWRASLMQLRAAISA